MTTLIPSQRFRVLTSMKNIEVSRETFKSAVPDYMRPHHKDSTVIEFDYSNATIKHFTNEPLFKWFFYVLK